MQKPTIQIDLPRRAGVRWRNLAATLRSTLLLIFLSLPIIFILSGMEGNIPKAVDVTNVAKVHGAEMSLAKAELTVAQQEVEPVEDQAKTQEEEITFWVILEQKADLSFAHTIQNWDERGQLVVEQLQATANTSQEDIHDLLLNRNISHRSFWIANAIQVKGDKALLNELAERPEVAQIVANKFFEIPPVEQGPALANVTNWNIERIRAGEVWATFGVRGEEIVVANIDSGVKYDHPALVAQYRGNLGDGTFDHNYSWFDPSRICGNPSNLPCDNNSHGTHTMGTMVGDDGTTGANQIGVAPGARWIAAKGCENNSCSTEALLAAGEWMLAPTDLNGNNPRPGLRPHIVNNSWGGEPSNPMYQEIVTSWLASGIFPAFANGNDGPSCGTSGSPGDYVDTYSVGSFDSGNNIANTSSRGASPYGGIKPNIAAPGVRIWSSVRNGGYDYFSGTSMASPHVAGTVALMWSAAPSLIGDIATTRALLNQTAIDTEDLSCGGTPENNNVWGEGRLDAFAAVELSPRGPTGILEGTVSDASSGNPIEGATIEITGATTRFASTDDSGRYRSRLPVGNYDIVSRVFGFAQRQTTITISEEATTVRDIALNRALTYSVTGTVRNSDGQPVANATVTILGTPIEPTTTDNNGVYNFDDVPQAEYELTATVSGCNAPQTQTLIVNGNETLDFILPQQSDAFGYTCQVIQENYIEANTVVPLSGDDTSAEVSLPFLFTFYGETYDTAYISTNGVLNFLRFNNSYTNEGIPSTSGPNAAIYPFWDDLYIDSMSSVRTELLGSAPNRQFVFEWRNVHFYSESSKRIDFEAILLENGDIVTQYRNIANNEREQGRSATVGIEDHSGTIALQYAYNQATIEESEFALRYVPPPAGFIEGTVTTAADGLPVANASVRALQDENQVRLVTSDENGLYRISAPLGSYIVEASAEGYRTETDAVTLDAADQVFTQNFALSLIAPPTPIPPTPESPLEPPTPVPPTPVPPTPVPPTPVPPTPVPPTPVPPTPVPPTPVPPPTICGPLGQEAEVGTLSGAVKIDNRSGASGGQYIHVPAGSIPGAWAGPDGVNFASYCVTVTEAGRYRVKATSASSNNGRNSFYVQIDGQPATGYLWSTPIGDDFISSYISDSGGMNPVELDLAAGTHTIVFSLRETGTQLDKFVFERVGAEPPPTTCGPLQQEAESGILSGGFVVADDGNASGGKYVHVTDGADEYDGPNSLRKAEYCFSVEDGGTYAINAIVNGLDDGSNSFYVRVNDAPTAGYKWHVPTTDGYVDDYVSSAGAADPVLLSLTPGDHTVSVYVRERRTRLDAIKLERQDGLPPPPPTTCGPLQQEAESGALSGDFIVGNDGSASGGQYAHVPDGNGDEYERPNPLRKADYCFNVDRAGDYVIKANVYGADSGSNSFYVRVDGGPAAGYKWHSAINSTYAEDFVSAAGIADPVVVALEPGEHTVSVYLREDGTRLDKITLEPYVQVFAATEDRAETPQPSAGLYGHVQLQQSVGGAVNPDTVDFSQFTIQLVDAAGVQYSTTVNAAGTYRFDNLPAGDYELTLILPDQYTSLMPTNLPIALDDQQTRRVVPDVIKLDVEQFIYLPTMHE